jgi:hypothetical protein
MRLSAMGDVAMAVPVLRAFKSIPRGKDNSHIVLFQTFFEGIAGVSFAFDEKNDTKGFGLFRLFEDVKN